ncbi:hypothetical protein V1517DRAFT_322572 [Lipomyces orientalis]|uniref:Uncharacterized protein n=1 Tax=Lipomyces orientalis TaxID=1233043 RepID=A0ACC3TNI8_9ASCO
MPDYLLIRPASAFDLAAIYAHIDRSCRPPSHPVPDEYRLTGPLPLVIMQCDSASPAWLDMYIRLQDLLMHRYPLNPEIQIIPVRRSTLPASSAKSESARRNAETEHATTVDDIVAKSREAFSVMHAATGEGTAAEGTVDSVLACVNASGGLLGDFETSMLRDSFTSLADLATRFASVAAVVRESRHNFDNADKVDDDDDDADVMRVSALALPVIDDIAEFWEDEFAIDL